MATLQATRKKVLTTAEWQEAVQRLADQVTGWSRDEGWTVERLEARVLEGHYYPPTLVIQSPEGRLMLELPEPEAHTALSPKLYAWPAFYRVWLRQDNENGGWGIWADSVLPLRRPWNAETFVTLAKDLLRVDE